MSAPDEKILSSSGPGKDKTVLARTLSLHFRTNEADSFPRLVRVLRQRLEGSGFIHEFLSSGAQVSDGDRFRPGVQGIRLFSGYTTNARRSRKSLWAACSDFLTAGASAYLNSNPNRAP